MSIDKLSKAFLDFEREHGIGRPMDVAQPGSTNKTNIAEAPKTVTPDAVSINKSGDPFDKYSDAGLKRNVAGSMWRHASGVSKNPELMVALNGSPKDAAAKLFLEHPERARTPEGGQLLYELLNLSGILDVG